MSAVAVATSGAATAAVADAVPRLVEDRVASRLFAGDHTLWGPAAEAEASVRLAWTTLPRTSRPLVGEIAALRADLMSDAVDRVVLCGMGGSSLAPEVICATEGREIVIVDSSHPDSVRSALQELSRTVVVVSSKSGGTVETDSQRRAFIAAFEAAGIDPTTRMVVVTDPGSPLEEESRSAGYRVVTADPQVGGRYSALTAFGLVPAGLAGVDVGRLLDDAEAVSDVLASDSDDNPALRLGAVLAATTPLRDKIMLVDNGTPIVGFGDWAEQLIAESTGKDGRGVLPIVVIADNGTSGDLLDADDITTVELVGDIEEAALTTTSAAAVAGSLGAQLLLWEAATAVAGRLLGINPFDQPDVESAKQAARRLLEGGASTGGPPLFTDGDVEIRVLPEDGAGDEWIGSATNLPDAIAALLEQLDPRNGYVAVMAYLDRTGEDPDLERLPSIAPRLSRTVNRPVTFGWGPRFLHSTGQYHKGGPAQGVYIQITDTPEQDLDVPGRDFTFGEFIAAQAGGDAAVLGEHARPVLRLHLRGAGGRGAVLRALSGHGR
ncbi:glucose-6-phosphate isomerase [Nostocoides sp. F2B08]|uniref:glucose-6-phosphate isomerase n=1 Tax=Nostocoides sp. F2B08 TaxID=2653936 RepID=UPI00126394FE|nr:glucose-6-phosphate isomerase [Tetrasphaera sp. F2B08]KAB7744536.1 glucose-6-phosphate isomerase [Tetrasphaera sp. F2B08]